LCAFLIYARNRLDTADFIASSYDFDLNINLDFILPSADDLAMSKDLTASLNGLLADQSVFYQKLRTYHWTVKGPMFFQLHIKFEEMYNSSALFVDELAERIVGLQARPLGSLSEHVKAAAIAEDQGVTEANQMVQALVSDLRTIVSRMRAVVVEAGEQNDALTANLVEAMADDSEKSIWMLEAYLGA